MKKKPAALDPKQRARFEAMFSDVAASMLKYFLRYRGLIAGMNDPKDLVLDRIQQYVASGELSEEEVEDASVMFRENMNKRVYLYNLPLPVIRKVDLEGLPKRIKKRSDADIPRGVVRPTVCYSLVENNHARVTFSEPHQRPDVDVYASTIRSVTVQKIIVLDVDLGTGFITLRYDAPEQINPHRSSLGYHAYYVNKAAELLGAPPLQYLIGGALLRLETSQLIKIPHSRALTRDGSVDLTSHADSREMDVYSQVDREVVARDSGRYVWLAGQIPERSDTGTVLLRDVPTEIQAKTSLVRFTKDCLEEEVEYVLGQIRVHS